MVEPISLVLIATYHSISLRLQFSPLLELGSRHPNNRMTMNNSTIFSNHDTPTFSLKNIRLRFLPDEQHGFPLFPFLWL